MIATVKVLISKLGFIFFEVFLVVDFVLICLLEGIEGLWGCVESLFSSEI